MTAKKDPELKKQAKKAYFTRWWHSEAGLAYREKTREKRNAHYKRYRQTEKGKLVQRAKVVRMQKKYPEKLSARTKLRYAVKVGKIQKLACEVCGDPKTEGHHHDYSKPLDVRWLCMIHHKEVHGFKS